jgi:hypothetical protein
MPPKARRINAAISPTLNGLSLNRKGQMAAAFKAIFRPSEQKDRQVTRPIISSSLEVPRAPGIKGLLTWWFGTYAHKYALDHCGNFVDHVAFRIFVPCGRSPDSPYFGDRRDRRDHQTGHRARGLAGLPPDPNYSPGKMLSFPGRSHSVRERFEFDPAPTSGKFSADGYS